MVSNGLSQFEQAISGICLFVIWLIGVIVCIDKNTIVLEWLIISGIISLSFFISIISYLRSNTNNNTDNNINANTENNIELDLENPSIKIKKPLKTVKIFCKKLPEDYKDVCFLCLEKLDEDACTISDCNKHFYHVECVEKYVNSGYMHCSVCKK